MRIECKQRGCKITVLKKGRRRYCVKHRTTALVNKRANLKRKKDSKRYSRHLAVRRRWATKWRKSHRLKYRGFQNACNLRLKNRVLSHYGKGGKAVCRWHGCVVSDLDMLTLDHVKDDGKQHRMAGYEGGVNGYRQLENDGYPNGFQTLCANHQFKKEHLRRRRTS